MGFGPLAAPPAADDPIRLLDPPGDPAEGWLRPGWLLGIPVAWMAACLVVLPVLVYVISYIPWAIVQNPQTQSPGWPPGHTGETLLDLTARMYAYHNGLTAAHPASSPWWAWPLNLKPVWFYQESLAGGTSAALYDAGSLVIWWLGIPAMAFVSFMAFKRRSLALALIAIGFAAQWIPWARIDRAAFQYHYYTALPFLVLALAYFVGRDLARGVASRLVAGPGRRRARHLGPGRSCGSCRGRCARSSGSIRSTRARRPVRRSSPMPSLTLRTAARSIVAGVGLVLVLLRFLAFDALA